LEDKSLEELVGEALFKQLEVADLEAKGGAPPEALREVRARGRDLREEGLAQASGEGRSAASQEVKALAGYSQILFIPASSKSLSSLAIASSPYFLIVAACKASEGLKPNSTT